MWSARQRRRAGVANSQKPRARLCVARSNGLIHRYRFLRRILRPLQAFVAGLHALLPQIDSMRGREASPIVDVGRILLRFSSMGYVAVATLVGSGLVNSWFLVGSVSNLLKTLYGQILLGKLALFAAMLALATANRFWL